MSATTDRATCTHPDILPDVEVFPCTPETPEEAANFRRKNLIPVIRIERCASCGDAYLCRPIYPHALLRERFPAETLEASALLAARAESRFMPHTPRGFVSTPGGIPVSRKFLEQSGG